MKLKAKGSKLRELTQSREFSLLLVMVLLCALIQWRSGGVFLSGSVISQLTQNYAYIAVLAFGMLLVLLIGGIDISIGATMAISGMSTCLLMRDGVSKRLFSSSSLSVIRVVSSAYLRLLIFLLAILISACDSSSPSFCMMYST